MILRFSQCREDYCLLKCYATFSSWGTSILECHIPRDQSCLLMFVAPTVLENTCNLKIVNKFVLYANSRSHEHTSLSHLKLPTFTDWMQDVSSSLATSLAQPLGPSHIEHYTEAVPTETTCSIPLSSCHWYQVSQTVLTHSTKLCNT
jgi:hypothetical protein